MILWTNRMHSEQPGWKHFLADVGFRSMSENDLINHFLWNVFFFQKFRWTRRMQIWNPHSKRFDKWLETFCSMSGNEGKSISMKQLSLKTFFWTPTEMALSKSTLEKFWQPTTRWKFFAYCPKTIRKKGFSNKSFASILSSGLCRRVEYWRSRQKFLAVWLLYFSSWSEKMEKKFSIRQTFSKLSNWTSKTQFWQLHRVTSARRPKIFTSMSGKDEKVFEATLFFSFAPMVNNMQFWQPHRNVPAIKP